MCHYFFDFREPERKQEKRDDVESEKSVNAGNSWRKREGRKEKRKEESRELN